MLLNWNQFQSNLCPSFQVICGPQRQLDGALASHVLFDGINQTVASVLLGNPGEQPAFGFQINAPGVDSIWQTAYVHCSKSPVWFLLFFSFLKKN